MLGKLRANLGKKIQENSDRQHVVGEGEQPSATGMNQLVEEEHKGSTTMNAEHGEYTDINFAFDKVNFDMLKLKRAFISGLHSITPVMPQAEEGKKIEYPSFKPVGDVLPIQPKNKNGEYEDLFNRQPYA